MTQIAPGTKFGMLTILKYAGYDYFGTKNKHQAYHVRCDCGTKYIKGKSNILYSRNKDNLSCGCKNKLEKGEACLNVWFKNITDHKKRGIDNHLTKEEAVSIGKNNCFYCDLEPQPFGRNRKKIEYNGIVNIHSLDRVHQQIGYTKENCVSCCYHCNFLKHKWDIKTWYNYLLQNYKHKTNPTNHQAPILSDGQIASLNSERKTKIRDLPRRKQKNLKRGILNNLDKFITISLKPCHYCGIVGSRQYPLKQTKNPHKLEKVHFNGIDRIDSSVGYLEDNVVPACFICNQGRSGDPNTPELSPEDFMKHLNRLSKNWPILEPKLKKFIN